MTVSRGSSPTETGIPAVTETNRKGCALSSFKHRWGLGTLKAMERLGLEPTPGATHHRGNDDAVEIARMLGLAMRGLRG